MDRQEEAFEVDQTFAFHDLLKLLFHFNRINLSQMNQDSTNLLGAISLDGIVFSKLDLGLKLVEGERIPAE